MPPPLYAPRDRSRVPPLDPVPGVGGGNPLAPRSGFRDWFRARSDARGGYPRPFGQMSDQRQQSLRDKYRASRTPPPTYNNPIASNGSFFDPNSQYGYSGRPGDVANSPIGDIFLEDNPDAAWMRYLAGQGIDPQSAEGQWARTQLGNVKTGWNAALATNPQLRQADYLKSLNIHGMFSNMSAGQRGENPGMFAPRARTISRGYN
jgi:hypothetical protein